MSAKTPSVAGLCQILHSSFITESRQKRLPVLNQCKNAPHWSEYVLQVRELGRNATFSSFAFAFFVFVYTFWCIKFQCALFPCPQSDGIRRYDTGQRVKQTLDGAGSTRITCQERDRNVWLNYSFKIQLRLDEHVFHSRLFKGSLTTGAVLHSGEIVLDKQFNSNLHLQF